jgi:hypothetical protein
MIRFRYDLRVLIFVATVFGALFGVVGMLHLEAERQEAIVGNVLLQGGKVEFSFYSSNLPGCLDTSYTERVVVVDLNHSDVDDVNFLSEFTNLRELRLAGTNVDNIDTISNLRKLEVLSLQATRIDDLCPLVELSRLNWLNLADTPVADISVLRGSPCLTRLDSLYLNNTNVSDIAALSLATNLTYLQLDDTQVRDISPLFRLQNLATVHLPATVAPDDVLKLMEQLPYCRVGYSTPSQIDRIGDEVNNGT